MLFLFFSNLFILFYLSLSIAVIKRFGVLKTASFLGLYGFFIGILFSILAWILSLLLSGLVPAATTTLSVIGLSGFSLVSAILIPIIYGILGFVSGLILTPIMNLALKITKGIDLDLELGGQMY